MSLIHQALTRPVVLPHRTSRFNPLRRTLRSNIELHWWAVALVASLLTAVVVWAPWQARLKAENSATADKLMVATTLTTAQRPPSDTPQSLPATTPISATEPLAAPSREPSALANEEPSALANEEPAALPNKEISTLADEEPVTVRYEKPTTRPERSTPAVPIEQASPTVQSVTAAPEPATPAQTDHDVRISVDSSHQRQVQAALSNGDMALAEMTLHRWIGEQPNAVQPRLWLAKLLLSQNRLDAIEALLDGQTSIEARGLLALWHERAGRPALAVTLYEQLAKEQPQHSAWQLNWAINAENSGQLALARLLYHTYLNKFAAENPTLTAFANNRVRSLEMP